ncbi:MAG: glycosyltransferase [Solobacterium sp.]|nr:glycosyltransferase [Solobacterium sp.]
MKVSVIVPMYNVHEYICECLDSLKAQTLDSLEVLIVDDGCTDNSPELAEAYVRENPERFHLYHKPNGGLSDARNYGIERASGEYIAFLDSDDFVEPELYEKLLKTAETGCDIVVSNIEYWYTDPSKRFVMKGMPESGPEDIRKRAMLAPMFAWNKLYRADLFRKTGMRYPLNTWYEDIPVTTVLFAECGTIGVLDECLIHYRQREGSIMSSVTSPRVKEIFPVLELVRNRFAERGLSERYHDELEYLHIENLCLYGMFRFIRSGQWDTLYEESRRVMRENYPNWKRNPYISSLGFKNRMFLRFYSRATAFLFHPLIKK